MRPAALRLALRLISIVASLVPRAARSDWRREWAAELECRAGDRARAGRLRAPIDAHLLLRAAGAVPDALWLRRQDWRLDMLAQDFNYAVRALLTRRALTGVAALTMALGIGANTAIFGVVYAVLLKPLPFPGADRLTLLWESDPRRGWVANIASPANYYDWKAENQSFDGMTAYFGSDDKSPGLANYVLTGQGQPERVRALSTSADFFAVLGVEAQVGRTFVAREEWSGESNKVVLSHGFWQRRFARDPNIVGQSVSLNGTPRTVVGVMPPSFAFPTPDIDLWLPFGFDPAQLPSLRRPHMLRVIGRLKPDVTIDQARADLASIARSLETRYPDTNTGLGAGLDPLHDWIVGDTRTSMLVFLGAVGCVLLIACVNVANLLLANGASRRREMAIRTALGAGRARVVRQLLIESLLLAAVGGIAGVALARWAIDVLVAYGPTGIPRLYEASVDGTVLAFTAALVILTALIFGLAPALQTTRTI